MAKIREALILGEPHDVRYKKLSKRLYGTYEMGVIKIDTSSSDRVQLRSLLHEFGHGVAEDSHDPDAEMSHEDFARLFEQGSTCLIRDNWDLILAVKKAVGGGD